MTNALQFIPVGEGASLKSLSDSRFKTMRVSVNMLVPLTEKTAAAYALLPSLVSRATRQYPDYTALNCRLSELYGASLSSSVRKFGSFQSIGLSASGIADRYAFGGENMLEELSGLLFSVIFSPLQDARGLFPLDGFTQEKRQLLEMKDAEYNDKMTYAHQRCEEILFQGQQAGINRCGSRADIEALKREWLLAAWGELLRTARFEIFTLGDCDPNPALFREKFGAMGLSRSLGQVPYREPEEVRRVTEEQPLSQSKLSMGFRLVAKPRERMLFQLMSAVLGGTPSSRLFQNVREKMGLCYYCSSSFSSVGNALYVESGVETANLEKTEEAVLEQLQALQRGEVTEEDLTFAKLALCNALHSVGDSLGAVENWYLSRTFDQPEQSPDMAAEQLMGYKVQDVIEAANRLRLDTVYRLKGNGGD